MNDANPDRIGADDADFVHRMPGTAAWLSLPQPQVDAAFVGTVLGQLQGLGFCRAAHTTAGEAQAGEPSVTEQGATSAQLAGQQLAGHLLTPQRLASYRVPAPSADFVARTLSRLQQDRSERYRALLARYVAPEPAPEFVARTLAALREERSGSPPGARRGFAGVVPGWLTGGRSWLLVAAAALVASALWWLPASPPRHSSHVAQDIHLQQAGLQQAGLQQSSGGATQEDRLEERTRAAPSLAGFAPPAAGFARAAGRASPAILAALASRDDPMALASGAADGLWLLQQRERR